MALVFALELRVGAINAKFKAFNCLVGRQVRETQSKVCFLDDDFRGTATMRFRGFALALALLFPSVAAAGPISAGTWSSVGDPLAADAEMLQSLNLAPFWAGNSWDGPNLDAGTLVQGLSGCSLCSELEYLNDGAGGYTPFQFTGDIFGMSKVFGITGWSNGTLTRENDVFIYDNGVGNVYNSLDNPGQFALFRLVGTDSIRYFLGIEDIIITAALNDKDYNDYGVTFTTPQPVPEPGTLLLLGSGAAALAARRKLTARKAQRPAVS
jgi:hypothetical protein